MYNIVPAALSHSGTLLQLMPILFCALAGGPVVAFPAINFTIF